MNELSQYLEVLGFTFAQAFASAVGAMVFGFIGAMGLWSSSKSKSALQILTGLALLPNALPIIFVIFSFMKYFPLARGPFGIVVIHTFLNAGLVSISIYQLLQSKLGRLAEIAWIEGAGQIRFLFKIFLPYLRNDLSRIFFFVFAICFTSFAVPLMIGGSHGTTIEVLIYQKIRVSSEWSQAFAIAFGQILFILALSFFVRRRVASQTESFSRVPLLSSNLGIFIIVLPPVSICFWLLQSITGHWQSLGEISDLALGSYFVAIGSGLLSLALLFLVARFRPSPKIRGILLGFANPSTVIVGFALIWLFRGTGLMTLTKLIFGLTLMHFPILYRLSWDNQIFAVSNQVETAEIIGASPQSIFSKIVVPQVLRNAYSLAGLAALWSFSDFTLASVVAERDLTLAQLFSHLTESYRWEAAENLMLPMILGSILCYFLFSGVGYVASRSALR